jgi:hypothetical protein
MKKYILILIFILSTVSFAEKYYAAGGNFGTNTGLNFLVYSGAEEAIQINTSFDLGNNFNNFTFTLDKIYFDYMNADSAIYYGVGLKLSDTDNENLGVRGVIGISGYLVDIDENLEAFAEFDPTIHLAPDNDFLGFEFGIGLRYYF